MMDLKTLPKLYQYNVCPFCWKVRALLAYKQIPYEAIEVHPLNKKEIAFSKGYRKVPIFLDEQGNQINDSTPIMKYIDQKYPKRPVFEKASEAKVLEEKWLKWADEVLVRALPPLIYRTVPDAIKAFDYITQVEKFSWLQKQLVKYSGALVMNQVAKKSAKSQGISDPEKHVKKCLEDWTQALQEKQYLGGDKPNAADLAVWGILKSIEGLPSFKFILESQGAYDWYQRLGGQTRQAA